MRNGFIRARACLLVLLAEDFDDFPLDDDAAQVVDEGSLGTGAQDKRIEAEGDASWAVVKVDRSRSLSARPSPKSDSSGFDMAAAMSEFA